MDSRTYVRASWFAAAIAFIWIMCPPHAFTQSGSQKVLGYYPDWSRGSYPYSSIPYQHLTHIAHSFLIPGADGSVSGTSGFAYPALVTAAHAAGVKVIAVLGGWDQSGGFSPMAADTAARRRFITALVSFCVTYNYDGVDLDWEYPANATDRANLTTLVHEMRTAFTGSGRALSISLALPATGWSGQWFDVPAMKDDVDWFGIMTYDFYGNWTSKAGPNSALYGSFATNSEGWIDYSWSYYTSTRGVPTGKLLIGIPFYGQVFKAATMYGASTGASQATYSTIAGYLAAGWTRYWDGVGMVPYLINPGATQTVSYDDTLSVRLKCEYARTKSTGGVMIWAIGQDVVSGTQPLLQTVGTTMKSATSAPADADPALPSLLRLEQNYPNPFNPNSDIRYQIPAPREAARSEFRMVQLAVYDVLGREVAGLVNEIQAPGWYQVRFDATGLASGVYVYRLSSGATTIARSMVLLR
jgi:chitinase